jgi:hypothetical protein
MALLMLTLGCGGGSSSFHDPAAPSANFPQFSQVVLVVEENHAYSEVIGNSSMPYLNSLASKYGRQRSISAIPIPRSATTSC